MQIRKAVQKDATAIRNCAASAYSRYVAAIGRTPAPMTADFEAQIAGGQVHAAIDDTGELQGFIVFSPQENRMLLENVAVRPETAGRGVGKSLILYCEAQARRLGLSAVHLYTNEKMRDNLSIYTHLGYVEVDRRLEEGFHRVFFEKRLT